MAINFSSEPYFDDFDETKGYYRILFRPGYAVQARELNQLQTTLQNQITRFGSSVFKEGSMVIAGNADIDVSVGYIKLARDYGGIIADTIVENLVGKTISNSSGLTATVVTYAKSVGSDPTTLFVRYKNSGTSTVDKAFANGDVITDETLTYTVQADSTAATGKGSISTIQAGVYYIKGHFVYTETSTIILDKYSNTPTYRIGLVVTEDTITAEDDESLFDNAQNSFNYAAPGAHRYSITTTYTKVAIDSADDVNFIELIRVVDGQKRKQVSDPSYSVLEQTLARRTRDESGDYTVTNFEVDVREYRDNNRGAWAGSCVYLAGDVVTSNGKTYVARNSGISTSIESATAPAHTSGSVYDGAGNTGIQWEYDDTPFYNRGINKPLSTETLVQAQENESKLAVGLEPGKAYVRGYEIEKTSTEYVNVPKAREWEQVDNLVIPATVGNYILVTNVNNLPPIDSFGVATLYDRVTSAVGRDPALDGASAVGTARIRLIEWDNGTIGSQTAVYKLSLFDINLNDSSYDFNRKVKSIFFNVSNNTKLSFSADIQPVTTRINGAGDAAGVTSYTTSGYTTAGSGTYIQGGGYSFKTDLAVGDYVSLGGTLRRVTAVTSQTQFQVDSAITVTGVALDRISTTLLEPENTSLIYEFPYFGIKDVRSALLTNDTTYTVYAKFSASVAAGQITITTPSGTFASAAETDNYIVVDNDATNGGAIILPSGVFPSGANCTINVSTTLNGRSVIVIAAVNQSGAVLTEKSKTLVSGATVQFTTQAAAQATELPLGKADGYRLMSVKMKTGTFASPGSSFSIDITDRYEFDDGQRSTHYGLSKLILKSSYAPPEAPIEVTYDYFTHSNGDYFTVNSYPTNVDYKELPYYSGIALRDCIDFRPRINDAGTLFNGTGSSMSLVPKRGIDVRADFKYYLPRKTKIVLSFNGIFTGIDGVSSLNPSNPLDPDQGMVLYNLYLQPYTFGTGSENIAIERMDNKRYTMRDIGRLEKRIDNLEYYSSLSLLEQQTESLDIVDDAGDTRLKNGFIVDGFTGHSTGDPFSPDYMCSIDMERAELRPFFSMNNINMIEKATDQATRIGTHKYQLYGDVITLPVVGNVELIKQPYGTRLENINPFAVFTFIGDVKINPSSDDWFEIDRRPDIIVDVEGNFTTIKALAEKSGVLGTVWNSWQNQWAGTPYSAGTKKYTESYGYDALNAKFGYKKGSGNSSLRRISTTITAVNIGQKRTGVKTSLVAKIEKKVVADRVLSTAMIPYMRSRNILIQIQKLKPNTRFYPFFDGVDVSAFCTQASKMVYTPIAGTGSFNTDTNVGGNADSAARRIGGDSQVCLNKGDIITGGTSGATAVVVGTEYNPTTGAYALFIVNLSKSFTTGEIITGSISNAQGNVGTVTTKAQGDSLITNFAGEIQLLFNIPNTDSIRFRCGTRELKLVDVATVDGDFTSRARANYRAEGVLETRQQTVNAVRNAELVEERLVQNRVITETSERVVSDTGWYDPLAQTFRIERAGGCFLSKIDIFFATRDLSLPVTLEVREVVNGYPGKRVLPFSRVTLKPEQVNAPIAGQTIDTSKFNTVTLDGVTVAKYDKATTFTFPSPVYVEENSEYAIVLASDSNNYKVWISQLGELMPGTSRTISEQPYLGSLFKSQNASTWTADQTQDLMFTIYRAQFETNDTAISDIEFVNDAVPRQVISDAPFETRSGTNKVRVWHPNHGFIANNSKVIITPPSYGSNLTGTVTTSLSTTTVTGVGTSFTTQLAVGSCLYAAGGYYIGKVASISSNTSLTLSANASVAVSAGTISSLSTLNGIPANELYTTLSVGDCDLDSYIVTTTTSATSSGYAGPSGIKATRNIQFNAIQPSIQVQTFPETQVGVLFKSTTGKSIDGTETAYVDPTTLDYGAVIPNDTNEFSTPLMIASEINETQYISGNKSMSMVVKMSSANDALSPILDTHRTSLITISNKINAPTETNTNISLLDYNTIISASNAVAFYMPTLWTSSVAVTAGTKLYYSNRLYLVTVSGTTTNIAPTHETGSQLNGSAVLLYLGNAGGIISTSNVNIRSSLSSMSIGKYISVSGATNALNNATMLVVDSLVDQENILNGTLTVTAAGTAVTGVGTAFLTQARVGTTLYNSSGVMVGTVTAVASDTALTIGAGAGVALTGATAKSYTSSIVVGNTLTTEASGQSITVYQRERFVDEIAPQESSSFSKYVTKRIDLEQASTLLKVLFSVNLPSTTSVEVYYKTAVVDSTTSFEDIPYIKMSSSNIIPNYSNESNQFADASFKKENMAAFTSVKVKIVMKSTNSSDIPRIKDLRVIACA